jgi:hypothetical protein
MASISDKDHHPQSGARAMTPAGLMLSPIALFRLLAWLQLVEPARG